MIEHAQSLEDERSVHIVLSNLFRSHLRHNRQAHLDGQPEEGECLVIGLKPREHLPKLKGNLVDEGLRC